MPPNRSPKVKGERAEVCFLYKAILHGLAVSKPYGDNARYDFIVDGGAGIFRVQVRSSSHTRDYQGNRRAYTVNTTGSRNKQGTRPYTALDIDVLAAYIVPRDAWYIVPVRAFAPASFIALCPNRGLPSAKFERFREAWHLFTTEPELTIASYNGVEELP
jgi:hypothetical protein